MRTRSTMDPVWVALAAHIPPTDAASPAKGCPINPPIKTGTPTPSAVAAIVHGATALPASQLNAPSNTARVSRTTLLRAGFIRPQLGRRALMRQEYGEVGLSKNLADRGAGAP
ncbi:MAG TPA: hypothetical protein VF409_04240, partial [Sphingomonas sp.]